MLDPLSRIDEDTDIPRRVLSNYLRFRDHPEDYPLHGFCFNCKTEVSFRVQQFTNQVVDEVEHCIKSVDSGGEVDPSICPYCGILNQLTPSGECVSVTGYEPRPVAGIERDQWTVDGSGMPLSTSDLPGQPVEIPIHYRHKNPARRPLTRIEWIDYFKADPAIGLDLRKRGQKRDNMMAVE